MSEGSLRDLRDIIKWTNMHIMGVLEIEEMNDQKVYSKK